MKDLIEVYFDNQIGIIEVETKEAQKKKKKITKVAEALPKSGESQQLDILSIIEVRNQGQEIVGMKIEEFKAKILDFFRYAQHEDRESKRLVVKIKSGVSEAEINQKFSAIYRRYKEIHKKKVGENFFKEIDD